MEAPSETPIKKVEVGNTIKIRTPKGIATAKVASLKPLDRVQIKECSDPSQNYIIFDNEDILEIVENPVNEIDYKRKYEELLAENKELKYQVALKDFSMGQVDLYTRENKALCKERDAFRAKAYDLESKVTEMSVEIKFLKNLLGRQYL